jgi:hypothetical protein
MSHERPPRSADEPVTAAMPDSVPDTMHDTVPVRADMASPSESAFHEPQPLVREDGQWRMSVELAGYLALAIVGALLRLIWLGARPLGPDEAAAAMAALEGGAIGASPLLHQASGGAMRLLGASTFSARLVPALAGALLAPAAWGLRRALGRGPALGTAAVLAVTPIWVVQSRVLEPTSLALLAILALIGAATARRPLLFAGALALALAAGDLVWLFLAAALLTLPIALSLAGAESAQHILRTVRERPALLGRMSLVFMVVLLLALTGLWRLDGLSAWLAAPRAWIETLGRDRSDIMMGSLLPLLVHAPELVLLGVAGLFLGPRDKAWRIGIGVWLLLGCGLAAVSVSPWAAVLPLAPLAASAGVTLARLVAGLRAHFRWAEEGVMIWILMVVMGYALLHAWRFANAGPMMGLRDDWVLMSGSLAMAGVLMLAFAALWGVATALRVAGVVGGMVCLWLAASNGVALDRHTGPELWRPRRTTAGVAAVAALAQASSRGGTADIVVDARLLDVLGWPLRDVPRLRWAPPSPDEAPAAAAWIGPWSDADLESGAEGLAPAPRQRMITVAYAWRPAFADRKGFVRWYLQRAVMGDPDYRPVYPEAPRELRVVIPAAPETSFAPTQRALSALGAAKPYVVEGWR